MGRNSGTELGTWKVWPSYTWQAACGSGQIFEHCAVSERFFRRLNWHIYKEIPKYQLAMLVIATKLN